MQHPEIQQIEAYSRRSLPGADMLNLGDHVAACDSCRALLKSFAFRKPAKNDLASMLAADVALHLSSAEIAQAAGSLGALQPDARAHLAGCSACHDEVAAAKAFYSPVVTMQPKPIAQHNRLPAWTVWSGLAAAVALAAVFVPRLLTHSPQSSATLVAQLHDGGADLALDASGNLHGMGTMPAPYSAIVAESLKSRHLPSADSPLASLTNSEGLRSEGHTNSAFDVVYPRSERTLAQPTFRWKPLAAATSYEVELYDAHFNLVEKSPALHQTNWTPSHPLAAGAGYRWAVNALTSKGMIQAPSPSLAEARFEVADASSLASITTVQQKFPSSHLLLASLYARAGMLTPAASEVDALAQENPGSPLVRDLWISLASTNQFSPNSAKPAQ